jgi:hypothetical protein
VQHDIGKSKHGRDPLKPQLITADQATRKQAIDIQAAILAALRKRDGEVVVSAGAPRRWRLKEAIN